MKAIKFSFQRAIIFSLILLNIFISIIINFENNLNYNHLIFIPLFYISVISLTYIFKNTSKIDLKILFRIFFWLVFISVLLDYLLVVIFNIDLTGDHILGSPVSGEGIFFRPRGFFNEPSIAAAAIAVTGGILYTLEMSNINRILIIVSFIVINLLTYSVSVYLSLCMALIFSSFKRFFFILFLIIILGLFSYFFLFDIFEHFYYLLYSKLINPYDSVSGRSRIELVENIINYVNFLDFNILFGHGLGYLSFQEISFINWYANVLIDLGIIGLLLIFALFCSMYTFTIQNDWLLKTIFLFICFSLFFNTGYYYPHILIGLAFIASKKL